MSESLSKQDKKQLAEQFYKSEEDNWNRISAAWYRPRGCPGRLTEEMLEQHHRQNNTGVIHPHDRKRFLVKIMFDELSYSVKHFASTSSANEYISQLESHGISAEIIEQSDYVNSVLGSF